MAIGLALLVGLLTQPLYAGSAGLIFLQGIKGIEATFASIVSSLMPSSVFEIFNSLTPMPLIILALLATYALCTTGKHFDTLKNAADACYSLFSRMLHAVMVMLPIFCFVAVMDLLLSYGFRAVLNIIMYLVVMLASTFVLYACYAIRIKMRGQKVVPFAKTLVPLLHENFKIDSVIEAAPFNIRYCSRYFKVDRTSLQKNMPVLAQTNLDGNGFLIMLAATMMLMSSKAEVTWLTPLAIALLVLFLSYGAPNQPGSLLIGLLTICTYMQALDMLCVAILTEAFLGSILNIVSVIGDIVLVTDPKLQEAAQGTEQSC